MVQKPLGKRGKVSLTLNVAGSKVPPVINFVLNTFPAMKSRLCKELIGSSCEHE